MMRDFERLAATKIGWNCAPIGRRVLNAMNGLLKPLVFVLVTAASSMMAQRNESHVIIQVVDPSGAVVTHAEVEIHGQVPMDLEKQKTSADGSLALLLPLGRYQLFVNASGFKTWAGEIDVKDSSVSSLRVMLQYAATSQVVEVCAPCPPIAVNPNWSPSTELPKDNDRITRLLGLLEAFTVRIAPPLEKTAAPIVGDSLRTTGNR
jgi:hypothetical protein